MMKIKVLLLNSLLFLPCLILAQSLFTSEVRTWGGTDQWIEKISEKMAWTEATQLTEMEQTIVSNCPGEHIRYQQNYEGLKVLGGQVIVHQMDGDLKGLSGNIWPEPASKCNPVDGKEVVQKWLMYKYPGYVTDLRRTSLEEVWADVSYPEVSGRLVRAYELDWHTKFPHGRRRIVIDACSGAFIMDVNAMPSCFETGGGDYGPTLYHGVRFIESKFDQDAGGEVLALEDGFAPIYTLKADTSPFVTSFNGWTQNDTAYHNGALDCHWGIHQTRDFYRERYQRDGIKGRGDSIRSFIFSLDFRFNNAYWDGYNMFYGAGDSVRYGPFTSIDICAHEMTHGVTEFTAGLEYTYEPGALNEAISDIFGKTIEHEYNPAVFSWNLGALISKDTLGIPGFRDMSQPLDKGHPQYYKGRSWWTNRFDNGGVHINSGVLNYWFHLLVEGGQGTAEKGEEYDVQPLGFHEAIDHVYFMLTQYLTPTSNYEDARDASMALARLQFANETWKIESIAQAWYAVGLGYPIRERDLAVTANGFNVNYCEGLDLVPTVDIINQSLADTMTVLDTLSLKYVFRGDTVEEQLVLRQPLLPGDVIEYSFDQHIVNNDIVPDSLVFLLESDWDEALDNNRAGTVVRRLPGLDFEVAAFQSRISLAQCERPANTDVFFVGEYNGCTPISSQDSFLMTLDLYGKVSQRWIRPDRTVYPGAFVYFGEFEFEDIPFGTYKGSVTFSHKDDPVSENDTKPFGIFRLKNSEFPRVEEFEMKDLIDSAYVVTECPEYHDHQIQQFDGEGALVIGGQGILDKNGNVIADTNSKNLAVFMLVNENHVSSLRICADVSDFIEPQLEFKVMRQKGDINYIPLGTREAMASSVAVNLGYVEEYLTDLPYDEFVTKTYDLRKDEGLLDIRIRNLVLTSEYDTLSGKITGGDRIVYKYVALKDKGLSAQNEIELPWTVFPNPVEDMLQLRTTSDEGLPSGVYRIIGTDGRILTDFEIPKRQESWRLDVRDLPPTFYLTYHTKDGPPYVERIIHAR